MDSETLKSIAQNLRLFLEAVGPHVAEETAELIALYREKAIAEPDTVRMTLEKRSDRPISPELFQALALVLPELAKHSSPDFAWFPGGHAYFHFLQSVRERIGDSAFAPKARQFVTTNTRFVLRAQLIEAIGQQPEIGFEKRSRVLADVLRNCTESWYKPLLHLTLQLAHTAFGDPRRLPRGELGKLEEACFVAPSVPDTLVVPGLRLVRNAVAHSSLEFDLDQQTITFVNARPNGAVDHYGPLSWEELQYLADRVLVHLWLTTLVVRRQLRLAISEPSSA